MTLRIARSSNIAIAAALTFGMAAAASAQARSDARIKVTKDAPGEVVARVDTVTMYRTDTIRGATIYRTDTVRVAGPTVTTTNTVMRYDTVTMEKLPSWMHRPSGLYFGLGGGATYAGGSLVTAQAAGYGVQAHLGVDPAGSPLGLRLDGTWNRPTARAPYKTNRSRATIMNASADLKLRLPKISQMFPLTIYGIGGGSYTRYKNLLIQLDEVTPGTLANNVADADKDWHDKWGFNAGGGVSMGYGHTELFVESRLFSFKALNAEAAHQLPFVVGINWY